MPDSALDIVLIIGGHTLTAKQLEYLGGISYEESLVEMAQLTFSLRSGENLSLADFPLQLNTEVELHVGWTSGDLVSLFVGDIQELTPEFSADETAVLNVICHDKGYALRRVPHPAVYKNLSHETLIKKIARRYEMDVVIDPIDKLANYKIKDDQAVTQIDETDFQILDAIATRANMNLIVHDNTIFVVDDDYVKGKEFHEAVRPGSSVRDFTFVYRPTPADLQRKNVWPIKSFSPELGANSQRIKVEVKSWAAVGADGARFGKGKLAGVTTEGQDYTEIVVKTERIETFRIIGEAARSDAQARYIAINEMERRARRLVEGELALAVGSPHLHAGMVVALELKDLEPFGTMFTGNYLLESCRQEIEADGKYSATFDVRRDGVTEV